MAVGIQFLDDDVHLELKDHEALALLRKLETVKGRNAFAKALKEAMIPGFNMRVHTGGVVVSHPADRKEDRKDQKFHEKVKTLQVYLGTTSTYRVMTELWIREGEYRENGWTEEKVQSEHLPQHAKAIIKQLKEEAEAS